jgi:hypothetical protein
LFVSKEGNMKIVSYKDMISHQLISKYNLKSIVEVGVNKAFHAFELASRNDINLICIDLWPTKHHPTIQSLPGERYEEGEVNFQISSSRLEPFKDRVRIIRKFSLDAAKDLENESLDMVFIDSTHTYQGLKDDIEAFWPKIRINGIIGGHDYHPHFDNGGMINIIHEIFGDNILLNDIQTDWYHQKIVHNLDQINRNIDTDLSI